MLYKEKVRHFLADATGQILMFRKFVVKLHDAWSSPRDACCGPLQQVPSPINAHSDFLFNDNVLSYADERNSDPNTRIPKRRKGLDCNHPGRSSGRPSSESDRNGTITSPSWAIGSGEGGSVQMYLAIGPNYPLWCKPATDEQNWSMK